MNTITQVSLKISLCKTTGSALHKFLSFLPLFLKNVVFVLANLLFTVNHSTSCSPHLICCLLPYCHNELWWSDIIIITGLHIFRPCHRWTLCCTGLCKNRKEMEAKVDGIKKPTKSPLSIVTPLRSHLLYTLRWLTIYVSDILWIFSARTYHKVD